ncbi:MAG: FAD binding domain-containing protein [Nocardioidaceae bacterium]
MKPAPFDYLRPTSLDEATGMLAQTHGKVLAGGQSLVPMMSMRLASPAALVDVNFLPDLADVEVDSAAVRVGALVRHAALEHHEAAFAANPLLRRALRHVAHPTIRNRGTVVGSLVHADPAAEMAAVLALLAGSVEVINAAGGGRTIPAGEFFVGPLESALEEAELAVAANFPIPAARSGTSWVELARRRGDYAMVGVGALVTLDAGRVISSARVALISVGPTPVVVDVGGTCIGSPYDDVNWSDAVGKVDAAIDPEADIHASEQYRRELARVLSRRALGAALGDVAHQPAAP